MDNQESEANARAAEAMRNLTIAALRALAHGDDEKRRYLDVITCAGRFVAALDIAVSSKNLDDTLSAELSRMNEEAIPHNENYEDRSAWFHNGMSGIMRESFLLACNRLMDDAAARGRAGGHQGKLFERIRSFDRR